jgi:hypothetical protein
MGNFTVDSKKLFFTASHPSLGDISENDNLINVISEPISDTFEIRDPGVGGGRVKVNKADKGRKITVECQTGSNLDNYLRRCIRYRNTEFNCLWSDERVSTNEQQGNGRECTVNPNSANDRSSETMSYEIISMNYSGD